MFPWTDGFHWTATHIVFLTLFFSVLVVVLATLGKALWQTRSDFRNQRAAALCWRENFSELPVEERRCRHELAGRIESRTCDNAFDCRTCENYAKFAPLPAQVPTKSVAVNYSDKLLYHRGHTWVRPEWDGTYAVGLDEFADQMVGRPDIVELPPLFQELETEGVAWRMKKNGHLIRVRAPLSGTVISTGGPDKGWYVKILPHGEPDLRHLLSGAEVPNWLAAETDRLQMQTSEAGSKPALADGGMLMPELMDAEPQANWDAILAATFLDP